MRTPLSFLHREGHNPMGPVIRRLVALTLILWLGAAWSADEAARVLILGDSLSAGLGLPEDESFPSRLGAALEEKGHAVTIINAGVSGDTSAGGRARLDWVLGDDPDAVILALGANDGLRGIDPAETRKNLSAILATLRERDLPVLVLGMLAPPNLGKEYGEEFNAIYPELAGEYDALLYPFMLEGVAANPELNQPDGIHPNEAGVAVMVENITPLAEQLLERIAADS